MDSGPSLCGNASQSHFESGQSSVARIQLSEILGTISCVVDALTTLVSFAWSRTIKYRAFFGFGVIVIMPFGYSGFTRVVDMLDVKPESRLVD